MPLTVSIGQYSDTGARPHNEDFHGAATPASAQLAAKGVMLAVADGVGGHAGGREAAESAVRSVLSDYYATPETWGVADALNRVILPLNRWVQTHGARNRDTAGMATTLSILVLRGRRYTVAHVGDCRVYRLGAGGLQQLTTDHVWDLPNMRHVLKRAIGLDSQLQVDFSEGELSAGDVFALLSDGVWEPLGQRGIHQVLELFHNPQMAAADLIRRARLLGGQDNATAVVARVDAPGEDSYTDLVAEARHLVLPPRLKPGERLDGFEVVALLHESRTSLLYQVRNTANGRLCVLKTLQSRLAGHAESCAALLNEEWLGRRVISQYFIQVLPPQEGRSCLYYAMSWHPGATLQEKLDAGWHFTVSQAVYIATQLAKGLGALHRLNIIHRDIKLANLHLGDDGRLRIFDLGVAAVAGSAEVTAEGNPGTPSYMAPELFSGTKAGAQSDLYAAGVTLYCLLTRRFPYGEVEPFQRPRFGKPVLPSRYRPDVPQWLENIVLKAVASDQPSRMETAEEMLLALEAGERKPILAPRHAGLAGDSLRRWQWIAVVSILMNAILLYLWMALR